MPQKGNEKMEESVEIENQETSVQNDAPEADVSSEAKSEVASEAASETAQVEGATEDESSETQLKKLESKNEELKKEIAELKDQYLRKQADFENFRKRITREKEEMVAYANQSLLGDLVTIIDDFERAIKSSEDSQDFKLFHDGIVMIEKQFTGMLERKYNLSRFESLNEEFDPQKHEAFTSEERPDHDASMVIEEFQKGYMLKDRVLRTAKVKVSIPGAKSEKK